MHALITRRLVILLLALSLCLSGPEATFGTGVEPPSHAVAERRQATGIVAFARRTETYLVLRGINEGKLVAMSLAPVGDLNEWDVTVDDRYRLRLALSADGAVRLVRLDNLQRDRRVNLEPPVELIPAGITAGEPVRSSGAVRVRTRSSERGLYSGTYALELKGLGRTAFETPVGELAGVLLGYEADLAFPLTRLHLDLETGWSPDRRLIYLRLKSTRETIGLFGQTAIHELILNGR